MKDNVYLIKPAPGDIILITENAYINDGSRFPLAAIKGSTAVILSSFVQPINFVHPENGMETSYNVEFLTVPIIDESQYVYPGDCVVGAITHLEERFFQVIKRKAEDTDSRQ